jgi:hypothetical protein
MSAAWAKGSKSSRDPHIMLGQQHDLVIRQMNGMIDQQIAAERQAAGLLERPDRLAFPLLPVLE